MSVDVYEVVEKPVDPVMPTEPDAIYDDEETEMRIRYRCGKRVYSELKSYIGDGGERVGPWGRVEHHETWGTYPPFPAAMRVIEKVEDVMHLRKIFHDAVDNLQRAKQELRKARADMDAEEGDTGESKGKEA